VASVDGYGASKATQQIFYAASGLSDGPHTLKIVVTGQKNSAATGTFVVVDAIDLPSASARYYPSVPQQPGTALTFAGRDSKIIVANYKLGASQLQYSTSEILTNQQINGTDVGVLYGRDGQDGETVLNYPSRPTVKVLAGNVVSSYDAATGDLRLELHARRPGAGAGHRWGPSVAAADRDGSGGGEVLAAADRCRAGAGLRQSPAAHCDDAHRHARTDRGHVRRRADRGLGGSGGRDHLERQTAAHPRPRQAGRNWASCPGRSRLPCPR